MIRLQIRLSQLATTEDKNVTEHTRLTTDNDFYLKKNADFETENATLTKEIAETIQKIDINSLLKQIDIEDLKLLA